MPAFVAKGPIVPDELVQDLEDDRVTFFCGAGISMGAGLPSYDGLVRKLYEAMGVAIPGKRDRAWMWPDRMVGELEIICQPGTVRAALTAELSKSPTTLTMHRALLSLARLGRHSGRRLVTTNFDTFFEEADPNLICGVDIHSGPALPIPRNDRIGSWQSVVHLHGRLEPAPHPNDQLVVTSADFGRAYLTDGWAARFVARLFADFTVVFVGYSVNDPVLRYMTDAFAAEAFVAQQQRFGPPLTYLSHFLEGLYPRRMRGAAEALSRHFIIRDEGISSCRQRSLHGPLHGTIGYRVLLKSSRVSPDQLLRP